MSRGQKMVRACLKLSDTSFSIVQPVTNINVIEPYSQVITDRAEPDTKMNPIHYRQCLIILIHMNGKIKPT